MEIRIILDDSHDYCELEYTSEYNRINAKGIREEIRFQILRKYGSRAKYYRIVQFYRIDDEK